MTRVLEFLSYSDLFCPSLLYKRLSNNKECIHQLIGPAFYSSSNLFSQNTGLDGGPLESFMSVFWVKILSLHNDASFS